MLIGGIWENNFSQMNLLALDPHGTAMVARSVAGACMNAAADTSNFSFFYYTPHAVPVSSRKAELGSLPSPKDCHILSRSRKTGTILDDSCHISCVLALRPVVALEFLARSL